MNELPPQYDRKLDKANPILFRAAKMIWDVVGEFCCDRYEVESRDGLRITIERVKKEVRQTESHSSKGQ
jgi:hypothetical protein